VPTRAGRTSRLESLGNSLNNSGGGCEKLANIHTVGPRLDYSGMGREKAGKNGGREASEANRWSGRSWAEVEG
jgi:hypothetical protein